MKRRGANNPEWKVFMINTSLTVFNPDGSTMQSLVTKKGNVVGKRVVFSDVPARDIRARLKATGLKGDKLTAAVNRALCGQSDVRWVMHDAALSILRSAGAVPNYLDTKARNATAYYVIPKREEQPVVTPAVNGIELSAEEMAMVLAARNAKVQSADQPAINV